MGVRAASVAGTFQSRHSCAGRTPGLESPGCQVSAASARRTSL